MISLGDTKIEINQSIVLHFICQNIWSYVSVHFIVSLLETVNFDNKSFS